MTTSAPTFGQIRAQVAAIKKQQGYDHTGVFGIHSPARWTGETRHHYGDETYEIIQCDSELAMRVALQDVDEKVTAKVLVTNLSTDQLSTDVKVRLARRKVYAIKKWQIVKELFQAKQADPRIAGQNWIAERLLDLAPPDHYPPVAGGVLDADTVWGILLEREIGLPIVRPDLIALLKWSMDRINVKRFCDADKEFRQAACAWLAQTGGIATAAVLACLEKTAAPMAVTVGLALAVVTNPLAKSQLKTSAVRIEERFTGAGKLTDAVADAWQQAATNLVRLHLPEPKQRGEWLAKGDELLVEVEAEKWAYVSQTSPMGFEQRLNIYGEALNAATDARVKEIPLAVTQAYNDIFGHEQANWQRGGRRLERIEMSARLLRWLSHENARVENQSSAHQFASVGEASKWYALDGGFVDWARTILQSAEQARGLAAAYSKLVRTVFEIRQSQNHRFAHLLRDWTTIGSGGDEVLPVERVLAEFVAPLAGHSPLLVLVIDGMSFSVFRELVADITRQDWVEIRRIDKGPIWPAIATIPSLTEVSRTSLLCGELRQGNQNTEQVEFSKHAELLHHSQTGHPPVLFHKAGLQSRDDSSLSSDVIKAIESKKQRVVGVVINAVDDFLAKGEQLDIRWNRDQIKVLPQLLYEARSSGRTIVLLSDHGHLLDRETKEQKAEGGDRWRHADANGPLEGELVITGDRCVIPETHRLIAPFSEKIRYSAKKNGYHGGITMQEMLVPMAALSAREDLPEGWTEPPSDIPDWWFEPLAAERPAIELSSQDNAGKAVKVEQPELVAKSGLLFDIHEFAPGQGSQSATQKSGDENAIAVSAESTPTPAWIDSLFNTTVYRDQKRLAGRKPPPDELVRKLLLALDEQGGKVTSVALSRKVDVPAFRLSTILAAIQRVLNVEGYSILTKDDASDSIEIDRALLFVQFGI